MANEVNPILNIYNEDGTPFHDISLRKHTFSTIVMSLNDKIEGEFYYKDNSLSFTLQEYVEYKGIKYILKNPPIVVRKGMTSENSEAKGMTKYSCTFYHEMIELYNIPFTDIAISSSEESYRSEKRTFSWIGTLSMFVQKINSCLVGTKWTCKLQPTFVDDGTMSDVLSFSNQFISDVCKTAYETWKVPFVVDGYTIWFGKPSKEILDDENKPYIFKFGQGVGLKNNDCTPKNNKVITRIAGYGSNINIPYGYPIITDADGNRIEHPYTRDTLMPSVYVEAVRNKVLFGSKEPLIDYYDADSSYPTPINPLAPVFHIQEFSSIRPTIEGMTYKGQAIDLFKEVIVPEGGWDDYIDPETGEVRQSYFDVTLSPLGFDLYAQAAVTSGMTFSMKSGDTLGANYEVAVDWEDVKKNFYVTDEAGNIVFKPNGEQRDYAKYPDSTDQAITIKLTKDLDTFGTIMPSKFQQVKTGDKFVILHIEMPQAYIDKAQERLDVAMKRYMLENNMPLYDYPLSFDEHFLETNQAILAQIKPNTIVRFLYKDNEDAMELSVKEMSIQYGTNPLPTYNITLTDEVSIVLNQIGQIADGLSKLGSQVAQLQAIYGLDIVGELNKKLSRVKDDTAQGMITFLRGLKVGSFVTGSTGGIFYADTDGKSHAELDYLTVRMKAMFYALEIIKTGVIGGRQMITPGGAIECIKIEDRNDILDEEGNKTGENIWDYWRCYFYQDDGTEALDNRFRAGDMALAQDFNIKEGVYENVSNHYFWRLVVNVGTNYIDISKTDADAASDAPRVGDTICQLGNKTFVDANGVTHVEDKTRQNAIIFSAVDTFSPSMTLYAGINSYSYLNKEYVSYGVDKTTNLAYMNVYGNSYIGARDKSSYMKFDTVTGVEIKGKLVTKSGKDVEETFNSFQDQIDGVKETWYGEYTPTLTNQPAVDWNTEALKKRHEGDVFTNIQEYVDDETTPDAGKSWRWVKTGDTWGWKQIADNDTSKAYLEAAKAQKAAEEAKKEANDAKQTVTNMKDFTDEAFKDGIVDRQEAAAIEKYLNSIKSIQKSVAESYSKVYANPLLSGTAKVELKTAYDGFNVATTELITAIDDAIADGVATSTEVALVDGRYDTFNTKYGDFIAYLNAANNFIQDKINTSAEDAKKAAEEAQKAADAAKAEAEAAKQRLDKWAEDGVISPTEKQSIKDEIVRIDADKTNITAGYTLYSLGSPTGYLNAHSNYRAVLVTLSASTPENITIPSDFASKQSAYYNQRTAALNAISDAAKAAVDTVKKDLAGYEYLKKAWKESTTIEGGVIQNALNMLGYTDPVAGFKVMSGMNGVYDATKVGGGIASWYGGSMKDRADYTEANMPSDVAKAIIRMDGSGYLASGAVWWGTDGVFHADPQSFIIKENQLGDYVSLFQIVYRSGTPNTISYMIPQYPMQKLTVSDYIEIGTTGYRIGVDSANNAIKVYKEDGSAVNFYASGAVSAKGISSGSGGGGGGLIDTVYGYSSLGGTFADSTLSDTFNAYTINKLASRITELEKNGGGGTGIAGIKVNSQTYAPDTSKYITLPNYPSTTITGTGNVLTNATYDNSTRVLTLTKGNIATTANHLERYAQITSTAIDTVSTFTASKTSVWEANGTAYGTTGANDTVLNIGSAANRLFQLRATYNSDDFYFRGVGASSFRTWYRILHGGNYKEYTDALYVKKAGDEMTGRLQLKNAAEFSIRMERDTSNYRRGIIWNNFASDTRIAEIGYQNTVQRIFLNPLGSAEVWKDAAGEYSFIIGNNFLTYNTWTILHSNNSTNYASGSVKVANTSAANINNTNRAGSSRVNFFDIYELGSTMPAAYGNIMEICSTRSTHWQPQLFFGGWANGHIFYRNKDYPEKGYGPWKQLIDSENYSSILNSTYVKKAGDTMTGGLTIGESTTTEIPLHVKSVATTGSNYIRFYSNGAIVTDVGYSKDLSTHLYNGNLTSHPTLVLGRTNSLLAGIQFRYSYVYYNILHAGNYKEYAIPYRFTGWSDTRSVNQVPNDYNNLFIMRGIKNLTTIGLSDGRNYATVWGWRGWSDSGGGNAWEIASTNEDLYTRHGETTSWTSWAKILNSSNYKDYMHDRFGTSGLIVYTSLSNEINFGGTHSSTAIHFGCTSKDNRTRPTDYHFGHDDDASLHGKYFQSHIPTGTQPFQCVSTTTCTNLNADLLDGFHGSAESTANTYVRRNQNKYISVNYINSDTAKNENHDFTQIITTDDGDNYYRKAGISFFMKRLNSYTKTIDLRSLDANKYYPISFQLVQRKSFIRIKIWNCLDGHKPTWATHAAGFSAAIEWDTTTNAWGVQDTQRIIYADNYKHCDKSPCGGIEQNNMASVEIVYLRGGAIYYYNNNDNIEAIINSNGYSWTNGTSSYSAPVINNIKNRAYSCYNLSLRSFSTLYCSDIISYRLNISSTSTFGETATFNGGMYSGNIFPLSNNNYRIGSSSNRFIDAYIQAWVYANSGLYMNPSGITQNGSYLELSSGGNEIIIAGGTDFYVNNRGASYGGRSVPKKWYWLAGSSSSWANMEFGDCTLHGWINSTGISASGANTFNVGARFSNTSHDSIEIVGGNYTMGLGCHSNGSWYWWRGTANPTSATNKSYVMQYNGITWAFIGSITATAAITAKATSDFRLKENYDGLIDYRERLLKLGRVYDYNYNKKALDLYQDRIDNKRHTGLVYQNAVKAGITNFCHEKDEYGYGSLNYLSPDLIATIIGSVQANILSIRLVESEQERMRKELEHAKSEINRLKGLVASLQN